MTEKKAEPDKGNKGVSDGALLPVVFAQAQEKIQGAADEAARHVQTVHLTFLVFNAYSALTVASTTHEQLLRESAVTLPLLNVGLPVVWFYIVAPALLAGC